MSSKYDITQPLKKITVRWAGCIPVQSNQVSGFSWERIVCQALASQNLSIGGGLIISNVVTLEGNLMGICVPVFGFVCPASL